MGGEDKYDKLVEALVEAGAPEKEAREVAEAIKEKWEPIYRWRFLGHLGFASTVILVLLNAFGAAFISWWIVFAPMLVFTTLPACYLAYIMCDGMKQLEDKINKSKIKVK